MKLHLLYTTLFGFALTAGNAQNAGTLDNTFGTGGISVINVGQAGSDDHGNAITVQSNGKIVVAGMSDDGTNYHFAVARYNADGTPDNTFSGDGRVVTTIVAMDMAYGVAVQPDGKIIAVGSGNSAFTMVRYNTNGTLDNTFGSSGIVQTGISSSSEQSNAVALQADGKILVAGYANVASSDDFAMARYNSNGTLDNTFGTGGIVTSMISAGSDGIRAIRLQPDGKIVAAGYSSNGTNNDFAVARYNTNGTFDNSFGTNGVLTFPLGSNHDIAHSLALQADGKIVLAGNARNGTIWETGMARVNANGTLDNTFGTGGIIIIPIGSSNAQLTAVQVQFNGKIVVGGYYNNGTDNDIFVRRHNSDGSIDTTFGTSGMTVTDRGSNDQAGGLALQADGKLLLTGPSATNGDHDFVVIRYNMENPNAIFEYAMPLLSVAPNPASDFITVKYATEEEVRYEIISLTGAQLKSGSLTRDENRISVEELPAGAYFVRLYGEQTAGIASFVRS
jgi:uncharacterized delta-60 repeat protein